MFAPSDAIVADGAGTAELPRVEIGKRVIEPLAEDQGGSYTLHDTFDGNLARAGALLLGCGEELILFQGESILRQTGGAEVGFVSDMAEGPVTRTLRGIVSPLRRLLPLGEGSFVRQSVVVLDDERKTQARCEIWTLRGKGKRRETFASVQRIRGYDTAFRLLRDYLAQNRVPEAAGFGGISGRLFPDKAGYDPRPEVAMAPEAPALAVANAIIRAHLDVARRNERGTIADLDTEFLHDYRVALRKVRSVVSLFKGVYASEQTAELKRRFGDLMAPTGRLRDLDVYLLERERYMTRVPEALQPGLRALFDSFAEERAAAQARLARHLRSKSYRQEIGDLVALFDRPGMLAPGPEADHPVFDYAQTLIWKRYRKVCRIGGKIGGSTPDAQVHELRIHCKKLRYAMELFAPLFDDTALKKLVKALKTLQDTLGRFNDYSVQQQALQRFVDELAEAGHDRGIEMASSVGALITVLQQQQIEERARVVDRLAAFDTPATRQGFSAMFHDGETRA